MSSVQGRRGVYRDTDVDVILKGLPEKQRPREAGSEGTIQVLWQWRGTMATAGFSDHSSRLWEEEEARISMVR